ncbi:MAG: hypothetical protein FJ319_10300 [SAR202 cluster bacterium]|nr:hypothetical protein [SAR202 cluster bacterium]
MIYYNACKRCQGDLHLKVDLEGAYAACLACGNVEYPLMSAAPKRRAWQETPPGRPSKAAVAERELVAQA